MNCVMKNCMRANPYKLILGAFLVVVIIIGANSAYSSYRQNQALKLAEKYYTLSTSIQKPMVDEQSLLNTMSDIESISKSNVYNNMSHILLAKYMFDHKQYDKSIANLQAVLDHPANDNMILLAYVRLVNVYIAQGDFTKANKIVTDQALISNSAYAPAIYEAKGDMYLAQKDYNQAIASYKQVSKLDVSDDAKRSVKIKLQLLGVNS